MLFVERLAVEIDGEGEPVVMIHGLGGTTNTFTPVLPAFTRNKRIRFDLPGSGRSIPRGRSSFDREIRSRHQAGDGLLPRSKRRT